MSNKNDGLFPEVLQNSSAYKEHFPRKELYDITLQGFP
jgi:hypothetical protein